MIYHTLLLQRRQLENHAEQGQGRYSNREEKLEVVNLVC